MSENNEKLNMDDVHVKTMLFVLGRLEELVKLGLIEPAQKLSDKGSAAYVDLRLTEFIPDKQIVVGMIAQLFDLDKKDNEENRLLYIISETVYDIESEDMAKKFEEVAKEC